MQIWRIFVGSRRCLNNCTQGKGLSLHTFVLFLLTLFFNLLPMRMFNHCMPFEDLQKTLQTLLTNLSHQLQTIDGTKNEKWGICQATCCCLSALHFTPAIAVSLVRLKCLSARAASLTSSFVCLQSYAAPSLMQREKQRLFDKKAGGVLALQFVSLVTLGCTYPIKS